MMHTNLSNGVARMGLLLVLSLVACLGGCGAADMDDPSTVYRLKLSHHVPAQAPPALAIEEWTRKVEEATDGRVQFVIHPRESLAKGRAAIRATEDGVCDVAMVNLAYVGDQWSLSSVLTLGSIAVPSERGTEIWDDLIERFPEIAAETSSVKLLAKSVATSTSVHVADMEIRVPQDIEGLKIAAIGDSVSVVEAARATPVKVSAGDWTVAAEKGIVVGCMAPVYVVTDRGVEALFDHHVDLGLGRGGSAVVINWEVWDRLPSEVQQVFDGLTPWLSQALHDASVHVEAQGWEKCAGQTVVKPTPEELALWMACFEPSAEEWIEQNAHKGPTREIYEYLKELAEE